MPPCRREQLRWLTPPSALKAILTVPDHIHRVGKLSFTLSADTPTRAKLAPDPHFMLKTLSLSVMFVASLALMFGAYATLPV